MVKALPDGDSKADDECPICMDAVTTGDWQVRIRAVKRITAGACELLPSCS